MSSNTKTIAVPTKNLRKPLYKRQQFLLSFIRALKTSCTTTDLQKLLFLHTVQNKTAYYDFLPYLYGCYSLQLAQDVETLAAMGWISLTDNTIHAAFFDGAAETDLPFNELNAPPNERGDDLLRLVYQRFPYFAINSRIADKILDNKGLTRIADEKEHLKQTGQVLFTIGYEGSSIEKYLDTLIRHDIRVLCDVRNNPVSRKFGFSKNSLIHFLRNIDIEYVHIPELGIVSDKRKNLETDLDYANLFHDYQDSLPARKEYLEKVRQMLLQKERLALTCFEHNPVHCHRHIVRNFIRDACSVETEDL